MGHWSRFMPSTGTDDPGHVAAQQRPPPQVIGPGCCHQPGPMGQRSRLIAWTGTNDPDVYYCELFPPHFSPKVPKRLRTNSRKTDWRRQAARRRRPARWLLSPPLPFLPLSPLPLTLSPLQVLSPVRRRRRPSRVRPSRRPPPPLPVAPPPPPVAPPPPLSVSSSGALPAAGPWPIFFIFVLQ
jgi:hypothetical protein